MRLVCQSRRTRNFIKMQGQTVPLTRSFVNLCSRLNENVRKWTEKRFRRLDKRLLSNGRSKRQSRVRSADRGRAVGKSLAGKSSTLQSKPCQKKFAVVTLFFAARKSRDPLFWA